MFFPGDELNLESIPIGLQVFGAGLRATGRSRALQGVENSADAVTAREGQRLVHWAKSPSEFVIHWTKPTAKVKIRTKAHQLLRLIFFPSWSVENISCSLEVSVAVRDYCNCVPFSPDIPTGVSSLSLFYCFRLSLSLSLLDSLSLSEILSL